MGNCKPDYINNGSKLQPDLFSDISVENKSASDYIDNIDKLYELSANAYSSLIHADMDESVKKIDLNRYINKILDAVQHVKDSSTNIHDPGIVQSAIRSAAEKAAFDRGDPIVQMVLDSSYRVQREIHRLMGLLRFNPRPDNIWLAKCAPDHFILPVFEDYFNMRFREEAWAIIDEKRNLALIRLKDREALFGPLSLFPVLMEENQTEDNWEELWRCYHSSVCIENRKNPALQRQFMPQRYWKYLPELNPPL